MTEAPGIVAKDSATRTSKDQQSLGSGKKSRTLITKGREKWSFGRAKQSFLDF